MMREILNRRLDAGDNIVDIHATSRGRPGFRDSNVNLSLSQGFIYERNTAKRFMEDVRKVCFVLDLRDLRTSTAGAQHEALQLAAA